MTKLIKHKITSFSDMGISLRRYTPDMKHDLPIDYTHKDDYYIFGFVEGGECRICVDFNEYILLRGSAFVMLPEQVHTFVSSERLYAYMLMVDSLFVEENIRRAFIRNSILKQLIVLDGEHFAALKTLFHLLSERIDVLGDDISVSVMKHLSLSVVGMISECVPQNLYMNKDSNWRYMEHTARFVEILRSDTQRHAPSYYAEKLNISTSYLNEAVKAITGINVTQTIQNEIILRAKRALVYSNKAIKEIAMELGFEDLAYFTRLFSKNTGMSPNAFRKNHK